MVIINEKYFWNLKFFYIIFDKIEIFISYQKKEIGINLGPEFLLAHLIQKLECKYKYSCY